MIKLLERIKQISSFLVRTPLHPQWLILRYEAQRFKEIAALSSGLVLDIGCSEQKLRKYLTEKCQYIGLDYPDTANAMYKTTPTIYGDAQKLSFGDNTFDVISFMEVLEHLPNPEIAVQECCRVLKPNGKLFFSMPFLYPIHDAPFDYQRFTIHGLQKLFSRSSLIITDKKPVGRPLMTAMLLVNIALTKTVIVSIKNKHPLSIMIFFLPLLVPLCNIIGIIAEKIGAEDDFMACGYTMQLTKASK